MTNCFGAPENSVPSPPPQPSDVPRVLTLSWGPNSRDSPSPPPPFSDSSRPASPSPALPQRSYNRNEWLNCLWWSERQGSPLNLPKGMNSLSVPQLPADFQEKEREKESEWQREKTPETTSCLIRFSGKIFSPKLNLNFVTWPLQKNFNIHGKNILNQPSTLHCRLWKHS